MCRESFRALAGTAFSSRNALDSSATASVTGSMEMSDIVSRRRDAASELPLPASSIVIPDVYRSNLFLRTSHQSTVTFCHAATNKSFDGLAVKYDTTDVSIYTVFLSTIRIPVLFPIGCGLRSSVAGRPAGGFERQTIIASDSGRRRSAPDLQIGAATASLRTAATEARLVGASRRSVRCVGHPRCVYNRRTAADRRGWGQMPDQLSRDALAYHLSRCRASSRSAPPSRSRASTTSRSPTPRTSRR